MPKRGPDGKFLKTGYAVEPVGSILPPMVPYVPVVPDMAIDVKPAVVQAALKAEVAELVEGDCRGNTTKPVPLQVEPVTSLLDFTVREQKYLRAVQEVIAEKGWPTTAMLAAKMGVNENTLARWRQRNPMIDVRVSQALERQVDQLWGRVLHRAFVLAVRGSIDHMTFLAKVTRRLGPETDGQSGVNVQVNIRV